MKKKIFRNLILLFAVLATLAAIYVAITKEKEDPGQVNTIPVFTCEQADVREIVIENSTGMYTLFREDESKNWQMKEYPDIPVNQTKVNDLLYTVSSVYATGVVEENVENTEMYGLSEPKGIATIRLEDGTAEQFLLGNDLPIGSDAYFMKEGDSTVYTVTNISWSSISQGASIVFDMSLPKLHDVRSIFIEKRDGTYWNIQKDDTWTMTAPYGRAADSQAVEGELLGSLKNLTAINAFVPTEEMPLLTKETAQAVITLGTPDPDIIYFVGDRTDAGTYFSIEGEPLLYLASSASFRVLTDAPDVYLDKTIQHVPMEEVSRVEVTLSGTTYTLTVGEQFTLNGKELTEENARSLYAQIIGLTADGIAKSEPEEEDGQNEIRYQKKDGSTVLVTFSPLGEQNFAVTVEGDTFFTCRASSLDALSEKIKEVK